MWRHRLAILSHRVEWQQYERLQQVRAAAGKNRRWVTHGRAHVHLSRTHVVVDVAVAVAVAVALVVAVAVAVVVIATYSDGDCCRKN